MQKSKCQADKGNIRYKNKGVKQGTKTVGMQSHQARIKKRQQERFCLTSESKSGHNRKVNEKREGNRKQKNRISCLVYDVSGEEVQDEFSSNSLLLLSPIHLFSFPCPLILTLLYPCFTFVSTFWLTSSILRTACSMSSSRQKGAARIRRIADREKKMTKIRPLMPFSNNPLPLLLLTSVCK